MSAKQLESRLKSLKERIDKKRQELSQLTGQQKTLRTQRAEAKKSEKAAGGKSSAKKSSKSAAKPASTSSATTTA